MSKINDTLINNAEDLDVVMPMYNLIEYSKNYRKRRGSLWNYYRDELTAQNPLNTRQVLKGVFTMLKQELPTQKVMQSIILLMMQKYLVKKKLKLLLH